MGKVLINWSESKGGPPQWSGLEHVTCEDRKRDRGMFTYRQSGFRGTTQKPPTPTRSLLSRWS